MSDRVRSALTELVSARTKEFVRETEAIFWGDWSNPGDIITGIDSFFEGWGGSGMAGDSTEYSGSNGQVTATSTYLGHVLDSSAAPKRALTTNGATAAALLVSP